MITLNYVVDDLLLASNLIRNFRPENFIHYAREIYEQDIITFQNLAYNKSRDKSQAIDGRFKLEMFCMQNHLHSYKEIGDILDEYLAELVVTPEFKLLQKQTVETVSVIKQEWDKNYERTFGYISNLGIKIDGDFTVYIMHPGIKSGWYIGNNTIIWAHQTYWPNYNTVYLWHEILHAYFKNNDTTHALIEFIADEEMRTLLNGGSYPPFVGHKALTELKDKLLPQWKEYLTSKNKDIDLFIKKLL